MTFHGKKILRVPFAAAFVLLLGLLVLAPSRAKAQDEPDTLIIQVPVGEATTNTIQHSPQKATLYAMVLPGLGQAYNKKYWKIPIVYAGFGIFGYFISMNRTEFVKYREAYDYITIGDPGIPIDNEYAEKYNQEQLLQGRDFYRRNLEFTYILTGAWYILTIIDAVVDAHLFDYDVSDDLGLQFKPVINENLLFPASLPSPAVSLTWRF